MQAHRHLTRLTTVWIEPPLYFITTCTEQRRRILDSKRVAEILIAEWRTASGRHGWDVGRYVIMPDHVHFFCKAQPQSKSLSGFVGAWKQWTSKRIKALVETKEGAALIERGYNARPVLSQGHNVWQREFFDHVLRSSESYSAKWEYVRENPVRARLVEKPDEWPYQGEIGILEVR